MPSLWQELYKMWETQPLKQVCRNQCRQVPKDERRCQAVYNMYQENEDKEVSTHQFDVIWSKVFSFHSIRSEIIAKLKTKGSQKIDMCEYKIERGSDRNLMPIRMYKMLFPHTNIN